MTETLNILTENLEPLELKGRMFLFGIEERFNASLKNINNNYIQKEIFKLSIDFVDYHLSETVKSDMQQLYTVGYFPATEAEMELDHSIKHSLVGSYKSAFADLRRALELTLISVYLTSETYDRKKAVEWVTSKSDTPGFSKSLDKLVKNGRFKDFNDLFNWKKSLQEFYWQLSDFSHNKGELKSYRNLNKTSFYISGTSAQSIDFNTLNIFCDYYIRTVSEIIVMLSLYNPIILVGIPIVEKFGLNGPSSGYFNEGQAELVHQLLPEKYKIYFKTLSEKDLQITSLVEYYNSLPDITDEEIIEQKKYLDKLLDEINNKK